MPQCLGGAEAALAGDRADGSVQFIKESIAPGVLVALVSAAGGEVLLDF